MSCRPAGRFRRRSWLAHLLRPKRLLSFARRQHLPSRLRSRSRTTLGPAPAR